MTINAAPRAALGLPLRQRLGRNFRVIVAFAAMSVLIVLNAALTPRFFTLPVLTSISNQAVTLVFVGMAQTSVVITGGIDLSVGPIISLSISVASTLFTPGVLGGIGVVVIVLLVGALCGLINGLIVVYGRVQPIIVTLATSSIYAGVALYLRPSPGGFVPDWYSTLLTSRLFGVLPASLILLLLVILIVWTPFRRSRLGLWVYATGGNESSAYMSGINVNRTNLAAYLIARFSPAVPCLFLSAQPQPSS